MVLERGVYIQSTHASIISILESLAIGNETFSTAESCTGGEISTQITRIPGVSKQFNGSVIAYANHVKINVLGVDAKLIEKHGAVSEVVASNMALGACRILNSDWAVSTTGIAGPSGGSDEKPVGTVWIAIANKNEVVKTRKYTLQEVDRNEFQQLSTHHALQLFENELTNRKLK